MDRMDPQLKQFYRQYMQQLTHPVLPTGEFLLQPDVQKSLEDHFFNAESKQFPAQYQTSVLDRVIRKIESAVKNPEDEGISDKLYECRARLALAAKSDVTEKKRIAYFPPLPFDSPGVSPIIIEEAKNVIGSGPNVGLRTWEAALRLAHYLTDQPQLITGRNVLELGAGTGFLSIFCAGILRARSVIATDGNSDVLRGLEHNIALNHDLYGRNLPPTSQQLEWGDEEGIASLNLVTQIPDENESNHGSNKNDITHTKTNHDIDIILGADITYHPDACIALAKVLSDLTAANPQTEILISATERDANTLRDFLSLCTDDEHRLQVTEIEFECPDIHSQKGLFHTVAMPIRIYHMRRLSPSAVIGVRDEKVGDVKTG